jgi:hypothetical protein
LSAERPRLALEPRAAIGVGAEDVGQDLQGDVAPQPAVARAIDLAHAARAERRDDLVRPKRVPGWRGMGRGIIRRAASCRRLVG